MTIQEAVDRRVRFVRLPPWCVGAHIELPLLDDGYGPWAIVREPSGEEKLFMGMLLTDRDDRYEATDGPRAVEPPQEPTTTKTKTTI